MTYLNDYVNYYKLFYYFERLFLTFVEFLNSQNSDFLCWIIPSKFWLIPTFRLTLKFRFMSRFFKMLTKNAEILTLNMEFWHLKFWLLIINPRLVSRLWRIIWKIGIYLLFFCFKIVNSDFLSQSSDYFFWLLIIKILTNCLKILTYYSRTLTYIQIWTLYVKMLRCYLKTLRFIISNLTCDSILTLDLL